ncbi:MAG TPA: DNA polymerase III subunit gamma/tau, partial [Vulgatibacter sp.]
MSYLVLARKWRPQAFDDVTGQEHVVRTLANAIAQDRVAHAFLLCGPRGVGKTTTARLLARALNCASGPTASPCGTCAPCREFVAGSSVDVVEIDGASNNGVDSVRELREAARYLPQRDRHKVFIIDEVHMLSVAAFNALLKTLEEPPAHVKFIFATTDPQKLPETILSRVQRHNFKRVPSGKMVERLRTICTEEGISISDRALGLVARQADGGMRDALSLLDQLLSSAGLEIDDSAAEEALGLVDSTVVHALAGALIARDGKGVVEILAGVYDRGFEPKRLCEELAQHLRDLVYVQAVGPLAQLSARASRRAVVVLPTPRG